MKKSQVKPEADMIDLYEQMLYERAANGIRPVLYVSSYKDLECSLIMLLDETGESCLAETEPPTAKRFGYQVMTN